MDVHNVQIYSLCERVVIIKVVKRSFWETFFSTPTHGFLIFFNAYSLDLKIFSTPTHFLPRSPPAIYNERSLEKQCKVSCL